MLGGQLPGRHGYGAYPGLRLSLALGGQNILSAACGALVENSAREARRPVTLGKAHTKAALGRDEAPRQGAQSESGAQEEMNQN
jgi:hypothetical protein